MLEKFKKFIGKRLFRSLEEGEITYEEMQEKVKDGAILLDVRSKQEYDEGHLNGAIQLDEYKVKSQIENLVSDKNAEIIVYCQNGGRSKKAYKTLKSLGYKNVYNLRNVPII